MPPEPNAAGENLRPFVVRTVIVIGLALAAAAIAGLLVVLAEIVMLTFGAILVACTLRGGGAWIGRKLGLPPFWGFVLLTAATVASIIAVGYFGGPALYEEAKTFVPAIADAAADARERLDSFSWGSAAIERIENADLDASKIANGDTIPAAIGWAVATANRIAVGALLVIVGGIFMGAAPSLYRDPIVTLFPPNRRARIRQTLDDTGSVLARWFFGRLCTMIFNGVVVGIVLWFLGIPLPWLLGLITGVFSFVPILGSWGAAVPVVLLALPQGLDTLAWAILAFVVTQHIENLVIEPLAMQRAIDMPPAYVVLSQLVLGALTGPAGVAFAVPFLAALCVIVRRLYVEDVLGDERRGEGGEALNGADS